MFKATLVYMLSLGQPELQREALPQKTNKATLIMLPLLLCVLFVQNLKKHFKALLLKKITQEIEG